jgi:ELWxxDGT repeat protein
VSDGTAVGTHELTPISGASTANHVLQPTVLASLGNEAVFRGVDTSGLQRLWVSDGRAAGTHELSGIAVIPDFITPLGARAFFDGVVETSNHQDLWVTDGTAAGTHPITASGASPGGLGPSSFVAFNDEVLFKGVDANGSQGLWVTDGTTAGTHELTGINGAYLGASGLDPLGPVVVNGEVVFSGVDAADTIGLWVTDGTAAGTHELTGIAGADGTGGLDPFGLTAFGGKVLFQQGVGIDNQLWVTDGTAAGTQELTGISGNSGDAVAIALFVLSARGDFNGDGRSDVLIENTSGGRCQSK